MKPLTWFLAVLSVFAPIKTAVIAALILVIADLITGLLAAHKQGIPITSSGIKRTVGKIALYEVAIILGFLAETYLTSSILPVCKLVTSVVGLTELKSILENMDIIYGGDLWQDLISKITASNKLPPL